jgi:hypothetical protein
VVKRRWRLGTVCGRGAGWTAVAGLSTSPLAAMDTPERTIDRFRSAEVRIFLKVVGIDITDDQLARLAPYLVAVRRVEVVIGSVHTEASEFARRGSTVMAFDHASGMLAVGFSDGNSALRNEERFASSEMAIRVFLSLDEPAHVS